MDGFTFGLIDNGIVLAGMYLGIDVEGWISKKLDKKSNPLLGAIVGATAFNTISDAIAAIIDPAMEGMWLGIALGCASVMLLIPVIEKIKHRK